MGLVETVLDHLTVKSVALLVVGFIVVQYLVNRLIEHVRLRRIPGKRARKVPSWAPFGLDLVKGAVESTLAQTNLDYWRNVYFKDGTRWTGEARVLNQRILMTADPENIKAILALQFSDFGKGEPFHDEWKDFLGDSIFTTDGPQWHASRQLIRPQFTKDRVSDLECFESHMQTLFRAMDNLGPLDGEHQKVTPGNAHGKVLDISELFFRYTLDVTTEFLLGKDTKSLCSIRNDFADSFNEVQRVQNIIVRASKARHWIPKSSFWNGLALCNKFINFYIDRVLQLSPAELESHNKGERGYTFVHALAGFTRDPKVLRDQIIAVLLAGRDTTASTLSWTLYELSRTPHAVTKLRQEILSTVGRDRTPTYEHLKNMPYLKAILNETLRLYPSVPFNVRLALKDCTLPTGGGPDGTEPIAILKDTPIGYSTLVMQRRPDLYPPVSDNFADPEVFSPERWSVWHPKPHDYIPFNAGPRICIGQQFALTEMSYVLVRMFQKYDRVESHMGPIDGGKPMLKADIVLSPGQGVKVAFFEAQD
ncbi:cytochrome P450 [Emericellopsis atlantica]|uniref:Cytochrome P450 n=1 Tax=Emericellopsis atlantica TaxID=2614577 RepID=A0A9P8CPM2_9HYPO|nr:cytochrome P450 [Emericellopsis atlantica]KAG9255014.1 cytochrome P450 [Emericellopsis atlantica]